MTVDRAASVRARLLNRARAEREEFERTLVRYAGERLLYRLGESPARSRCLLKGASLLAVWLAEPHRATRDIDLLAHGVPDEQTIRTMIRDICAVPCPEDGLRFDLSELAVTPIRAEEEHAGHRARFRAFLGTARIVVQVDFGFGDAASPEPEEIELPVLLDELPRPRLRAYPREASLAEKFEAMVTLDVRNSRMKDFHDVWALSEAFAFAGPKLRRTIERCFERRGTALAPELPRPLTAAFYERPDFEARWAAYLASGAVIVPPPTRFDEVGERILRFLGPVRESIADGTPFERHWPAGGSWESGAHAHGGDRRGV